MQDQENLADLEGPPIQTLQSGGIRLYDFKLLGTCRYRVGVLFDHVNRVVLLE